MSDLEHAVLTYLKTHPYASRKQLMRATGASAREVRRAEARLDAELLARRQSRRRRALVGSAALVVASIGGVTYWAVNARWEADLERKAEQQAKVNREREKEIYAALDRRDDSRTAEYLEHLRDEDEGLRLAALRYLTSLKSGVDPAVLVPLMSDSSDRVRLAAIQLVGRLEGQPYEAGVVSVALDPERPLNERTLALTTLRERRGDRRTLARQILPLLLDKGAALREQVNGVLEELTRLRVDKELQGQARHDAWAGLLREAS